MTSKVFSEDQEQPYLDNQVNFTKHNAQGTLLDLELFALDLARKHIYKLGSFSPFGVTITTSGKYRLLVGSGKDTRKDLDVIIASYRKKAASGEIVAAVVVYDTQVKVADDTQAVDAIYFTSDSRFTESKSGFTTYSKNPNGQYLFGQITVRASDKTAFFR